ncbi:MAG: DUF480 domain-containing protein [Planctomycetota bacterium]
MLSIWPASGQAVRWKEELTRKHQLAGGVELVMGELFLRGPQTEGELRGRAARMRPVADLAALREILSGLHAAAFVVRLSPGSAARGVRVTHALYPPAELEREIAEASSPGAGAGEDAARAVPARAAAPSEIEDLCARVAALEERIARLEGRA